MSDFLIADEPTRFNGETLDRLLLHCIKYNASDITFQSNSVVFAEIFGRLAPITMRKLTNTEVGDILNTIYGTNGTTQIYSGKDVDTHYEIRPNRKERHRFRVNGTGCQVEGHDGIQITIRTIPAEPPDLDDLNIEDDIVKNMSPEQGTIVVTGATGSGKSTLLAAIIKKLLQESEGHRKMLTYESPIEFVYDMVNAPTSIMCQSEIPRHLPSFAAGVRNALRRKPRLILVGEARDEETIAAVIEAALTGHPVYTTLHSNGVSDAVRRMITTFPAEERNGRALDILETIRMVIWQKLVKSVDGKRVALREYLVFDDKVRDALVNTEVEMISAHSRELLKKYGRPMIVDAKEKFTQGKISKKDYDILSKQSEMLDRDAQLRSN